MRRARHSVRVIRDLAGLSGLESAWDALCPAGAGPMQHYIWARAAAQTFAAGRLRVVAIEAQGRIVAIAPLRTRGSEPTMLEVLGVTELYEPTDLLYADPAALATLAAVLANMRLPLRFGRLPAASPTVAALEKACKGWVVVGRASHCTYLALGAGGLRLEQQLNAERRFGLHRAARQAATHGRVTYEMVLRPPPEEFERLLDELQGAETDATRGAFFRAYAAAACRRGILRLGFMRINGAAAAMQLAVECDGGFWLLQTCRDERFAGCSPGTLLMLHTVRYAALRGLRSYEFLGAEAPWTQGRMRRVRPMVNLQSYPPSVHGSAPLSVDAANRIGMSLQRFLRPG